MDFSAPRSVRRLSDPGCAQRWVFFDGHKIKILLSMLTLMINVKLYCNMLVNKV